MTMKQKQYGLVWQVIPEDTRLFLISQSQWEAHKDALSGADGTLINDCGQHDCAEIVGGLVEQGEFECVESLADRELDGVVVTGILL